MSKMALRQKRVIKEVLENGSSMHKAMLKAGYSEAYAKQPGKLAESKTWEELLERDLPDDLLTETAKKGLKSVSYGITGKKRPDWNARQKYLETSLKMKGRLVDRHDLTSEGEKIVGFTFVSPTDVPTKPE
jgi:hypothetical protein